MANLLGCDEISLCRGIMDRVIERIWFFCFTLAWHVTRRLSPATITVPPKPIAQGAVAFTDHNVVLNDGSQTLPSTPLLKDRAECISACKLLETIFPCDRAGKRIVDIGCLEGGYATEFARMGFDSLGLEVRESNIAACEYVRSNVSLPNLSFVKDDAWNIAQHGVFDATFCCGLFYHLRDPRAFLDILGKITSRVLIINTHFAPESFWRGQRSHLTPMVRHEGCRGRWFPEFPSNTQEVTQEALRWAAWGNDRSFWMTREALLQGLRDAGFDTVFEQFDQLGDDIAGSMRDGYYAKDSRGVFVGIKTGNT
jgi:SAM-dependent methyltransferase